MEKFKYTLDNIDYCIKVSGENMANLKEMGYSIYSKEIQEYVSEFNKLISIKNKLPKRVVNILNENYKQLSIFDM